MNVHTIDLKFRNLPQCIAAFLVESGGELALVETGPSSCQEALHAGIRALGFAPEDVSKVLLTHIHLDHAGAAGWWAGQGAQVHVHERGAKHLVDPTKLMEGAGMVYGDALESLWGAVDPVPADRVTPLADGDRIAIGEESLTAWDTPGHAWHHHSFVGQGLAFTGDVAGVRLPDCRYISATTAPSQFDPGAYGKSLDRLAAGGFERLYLTHFGVVETVDEHLQRYRAILEEAAEIVWQCREDGLDREGTIDAFYQFNRKRARADGLNWERWLRYETANDSGMSADGIALYWEKQSKA